MANLPPPNHPLSAICQKVERANKLIEEFEGAIAKYFFGGTFKVEVKKGFLNEPTRYCIDARLTTLPPLDMAILCGDILHNLRTSLDQLVTQLAIANGASSQKSHSFVISVDEKRFLSNAKKGSFSGLSKDMVEEIKNSQPFKAKTPEEHHLEVLRVLNNIDKHALPISVAGFSIMGPTINIGGKNNPTITSISPPEPASLSENFATLLYIDLETPNDSFSVESEFEMSMNIHYDKTNSDLHAMALVTTLSLHVSDLLERFKHFFPTPSHYEIPRANPNVKKLHAMMKI